MLEPCSHFPPCNFSAEPCEPSCPIPNQNIPASTAAAPGSSVLAAAGTSGGAGGGGAVPAHQHHAPYDLRRKSPSHHCEAAAAGGAGPSTSAATAGGSPASPATPTAPAGGYTSAMLPARKRPRRTCSASYESEYCGKRCMCRAIGRPDGLLCEGRVLQVARPRRRTICSMSCRTRCC